MAPFFCSRHSNYRPFKQQQKSQSKTKIATHDYSSQGANKLQPLSASHSDFKEHVNIWSRRSANGDQIEAQLSEASEKWDYTEMTHWSTGPKYLPVHKERT